MNSYVLLLIGTRYGNILEVLNYGINKTLLDLYSRLEIPRKYYLSWSEMQRTNKYREEKRNKKQPH
jgi:hypothetical protein